LKEILQERFYNWERNELMAALRHNGVPAGSVLNMQEVFENKVAKDMVLDEIMADGTISKRVRTAAFYWD
jgi:crotonobetainyl-CoA:carnitine CoA-transferase CaiB-like acyl-CoA transferase